MRHFSSALGSFTNISLACVVALFGAGCGAETGEGDLAREELAQTTLTSVCVLASNELRIASNSVVQLNVAAGRLDAGPDVLFNSGEVLVGGNAFLRDRVRVVGNVTAAGAVTRGNGVAIGGALLQNTPVTVPVLQGMAVPAGDEDVFIPPRAQVTLLSGGYGDVLVGAGAVVSVSGTYDVRSLTVEPDARLVPTPLNANVAINSVGSISFGDRSAATFANPLQNSFRIFSGGLSVSIGADVRITGIIVAPVARVEMRSRSDVNGCVGGRDLILDPNTRIVAANTNASLPIQ